MFRIFGEKYKIVGEKKTIMETFSSLHSFDQNFWGDNLSVGLELHSSKHVIFLLEIFIISFCKIVSFFVQSRFSDFFGFLFSFFIYNMNPGFSFILRKR